MVENDFITLAHTVIEQWRNENVPLNPGATEDELLAFEKRFALTLPPDFHYFYSLVNGMTDYLTDEYLFSLWPLEGIAKEIEISRFRSEERDEETSVVDREVEKIRQPLANCKIEIAFGDVLIDSWRYLLCEDEEGRFFVSSQMKSGERLADSFGHFLQRYLNEPEKIYL
jgi:hypothetical protein